MGFGQYWTLFCFANSSAPSTPICDFCSSDRDFAAGFIQIPRRRGHPCHKLTVPTAKPVTDFHRQAVAPAGLTKKKSNARAFDFLHGSQIRFTVTVYGYVTVTVHGFGLQIRFTYMRPGENPLGQEVRFHSETASIE